MTRRLAGITAAACTALALLAGCGGAPIEESVDAAVGAVNENPATADSTVAQPGRPATTTRTGGDAAQAATTGTNVAADTQAAAGSTGTATGPAKNAGAKNPAGTGGKAAGAGQSAVERLVATHPIYGGNAPCAPATLSEIPIGNVSTLSGVVGEVMSPARSALEVFVAAQNACGGLNGHRIKLYIEDDQGDPATASSKVQDMILKKKILAFVGNIQLLTIDAVVPVINKHGIPIIGGDLASNTWFSNPLIFPQGTPPASVAYGYLKGATEYFNLTEMGDIWCIEIPRGCEQNDRALKELAPQFGVTVKKSIQASITAPSYVQQCLDFKNAGVKALALLVDAATMVRMARSCQQVGYFPKVLPTPLGVGAEKQFLTGNKWLGDAYVTLNFFPWFAGETPAQKYWQAMVRKYNPGMDLGTTASAGWTAGALLVAAAAELGPTTPTTADLLRGLYAFQGQKWTGLGGLSGPRTFTEGKKPRAPYCLFTAISNPEATGWARSVNTPQCSTVIAPSDPQNTP